MNITAFELAADEAFAKGASFIHQQYWAGAQIQFQIALSNYLGLLQEIGGGANEHLFRRIGECGVCLSESLRYQGHEEWWQPLVQYNGYLQHACAINASNPENQRAFNYAANLYKDAVQEAAAAHAQMPQQVGGDEDEDGFSLSRAILLCRASKTAYLPNQLPPGACKFSAREAGGVLGFAYDTGQEIFITYRGSTKFRLDLSSAGWLAFLRDWLGVNAGCHQVPAYGGRVHAGFAEAAEETWDDIVAYLKPRFRGQTVWITGHSMGAAVATLIAQRLWDANCPPAGVYTFGSPKIGDSEFCRRYQPKLYRVENGRDLVPHIPVSEDEAEALGKQGSPDAAQLAARPEYSEVGVLRWIDSRGRICKPTLGVELRRALQQSFRGPSARDHDIDAYLAKLEAIRNTS